MPTRSIHVQQPSTETAVAQSAQLAARFDAIRAELKVPEAFPPDVEAEAAAAAASPGLPDRDETSVPFLTIDPPGSMDLDQALHIERDGDGYRVRYAIADVPAFVKPGGAVDAETRRRGQTVYAPDKRTPLHPTVLSEGAASLLAGETRPAFVWDLRLKADGDGTDAEVYRAMVKSTDRLDYEGVQKAIDDGSADERLLLLKEVGQKRIELERRRGGASLPMPEQEVNEDDQGHYRLYFRPPLDVEDWNAQISLLTGMAAAEMMIKAKVGILRSMPAPDQNAIGRFRHASRALGIEWQEGTPYGEFLRTLDRTNPKHLALIHEATSLFRGAGYTPFDGEAPDHAEHAAVAAPYAHVTAPLRRLVDRFGLAICEAVSSGGEVPGWAREALPSLPEVMSASDKVANGVERGCADAVEAAALEDRVGEVFDAMVVDKREKGDAVVQIQDPAVLANAEGQNQLGTEVKVKLTEATISTGTVRFEIVH
ncbi:RNB domain-containing ribonuclease [Pedococcus bigeumensis]|uniref:RNB domain-containing ribonuclease n=1 Tax=Pedococcus bigeumensis TaxID=433644 RepID=A0A502D4F9_9MICO|nr:RNB domain-containing ribonuclease [Pedococcus bigeumensis]TPG19650.1 RNB domain-containing ribonuclease [Pedococcus bigeumensis]